MIKTVTTVKRKPDMPVADFQAYWLEKHPAVVTALPGLVRYVQSHTRPGGYRSGEPALDGIAEAWFGDTAALMALRGTPELDAVFADEEQFIDRGAIATLLVDEHVMMDAPWPREGPKSVEVVYRRPDLPLEEFRTYWREVIGPLGVRIPQLRRYVQNHVRPSAYRNGRQPAFDGPGDFLVRFDGRHARRRED